MQLRVCVLVALALSACSRPAAGRPEVQGGTTAMSIQFQQITPNLVASDMARSVAFYQEVLGFTTVRTVPDQAPFVFAWLRRDETELFLNDAKALAEELAPDGGHPAAGMGLSGLFIIMSGVDALHDAIRDRATVVMELRNTFYGMREFAVTDPDGHVLTFAERTGEAEE
jgi:uncharacterized glyoxalase superfamily protein PhnB